MGALTKSHRRVHEKALVLFSVFCVVNVYLASANIDSNGEGSYCISKIPRRSVAANCTSDSTCEELLGVSISEGNYIKCGSQGECITTQLPKNEYCKDVCEKAECSKYCLQVHEAKKAMYCIETRDHPNAMPNTNSTSPAFQNKYYCTCVMSAEEPHRHRIFSRYLKYRLFTE